MVQAPVFAYMGFSRRCFAVWLGAPTRMGGFKSIEFTGEGGIFAAVGAILTRLKAPSDIRVFARRGQVWAGVMTVPLPGGGAHRLVSLEASPRSLELIQRLEKMAAGAAHPAAEVVTKSEAPQPPQKSAREETQSFLPVEVKSAKKRTRTSKKTPKTSTAA